MDWDAHELAAIEGDDSVSLEEVQQALSKIRGSLGPILSEHRLILACNDALNEHGITEPPTKQQIQHIHARRK